jgi:DNA-binding IclR family transcriptional regulator
MRRLPVGRRSDRQITSVCRGRDVSSDVNSDQGFEDSELAKERNSKTSYSIEAVSKALAILQVFIDEKKQELSLTEITSMVEMNKNAVFRLLFTLTESDFLKKVPDNGKYQLSLKCVQLGRAARLAHDLRKLAFPYMKELWKEFGDTVNLAVLDQGEICYLEVLESPHRFKLVAHPGDRDPVHSTALGKSMLAYLPIEEVKKTLKLSGMPRFTPKTITTYPRFKKELAKIRQQGYALNEGETVEASRCVAVPIFGGKDNVVGAISVSGTAARITDDRIHHISQSLLKYSSEISKQIE